MGRGLTIVCREAQDSSVCEGGSRGGGGGPKILCRISEKALWHVSFTKK